MAHAAEAVAEDPLVVAAGLRLRLRELTADVMLGGIDALEPAEQDEWQRLQRVLPAEAAAEWQAFATASSLPLLAWEREASPQPSVEPRQRDRVLAAVSPASSSEMPATLRRAAAATSTLAFHRPAAFSWRTMSIIGFVAAAVSLLLAAGIAYQSRGDTVDIGPLLAHGPVRSVGGTDSTASYRLARDAEAVRVWLSSPAAGDQASFTESPPAEGDEAGATFVWSGRHNAGLLQIVGLPANDPASTQYQAWILDAGRPDDAAWVDCGLFNIEPASCGSTGNVTTLQIRAKLPVERGAAVVVTREPAGGSAVGGRSEVVLRADLPDA